MKIRPVGAELFSADRQTVVQCGQTDSCSVRTDRHGEANSRFFAILRTRLVICWCTYRPWICAAVTARCDDRAKHINSVLVG